MWTHTVTYACVTHMNQYHTLHTSAAPCTPMSSCVTHIRTNHVTHVKEYCRICVCCHTHESVAHIAHQRSAVHPHVVLCDTHINKSSHTCKPVLSHMRTVTHMRQYNILQTSAAPRTPISSCVTHIQTCVSHRT